MGTLLCWYYREDATKSWIEWDLNNPVRKGEALKFMAQYKNAYELRFAFLAQGYYCDFDQAMDLLTK